jgi:hypothetical protein
VALLRRDSNDRIAHKLSTGVTMNAYTAHPGFGLGLLRDTLHLPKLPVRRVSRPAPAAPAPGWLEQLACWAQRQPVHRRLGSYTLLR